MPQLASSHAASCSKALLQVIWKKSEAVRKGDVGTGRAPRRRDLVIGAAARSARRYGAWVTLSLLALMAFAAPPRAVAIDANGIAQPICVGG